MGLFGGKKKLGLRITVEAELEIRSLLEDFRKRRSAPELPILYDCEIDEYEVRINERRPSFRDANYMSVMTIAKFVYVGHGGWMLFCADRDSKWHIYDGFETVSFAEALIEVESDPTGIFFG